MSYISSNDNRFYVANERAYGVVGTGGAFTRIPAVKLTTHQQRNRTERKDKTGSRTFVGYPPGTRRSTTFELRTYMRDWADVKREPAYGPLFQACLGKPAVLGSQMAIGSTPAADRVTFGTPHN